MERESTNSAVQNSDRSAQRENHTGIPMQLKERMEQSTGLPFDDMRVHYNSTLPARLNALAYTQGNQVAISPERELPADEIGAGKTDAIVQRVVILGGEKIDKKYLSKNGNSQVLIDIQNKVTQYAIANDLNADQLKRTVKRMITENNPNNPYEFNDISELVEAAYQRTQAKEAHLKRFECLYNDLKKIMEKNESDVERIFAMTPDQFGYYLLESLQILGLRINSGEDFITMNHKSSISHIAGTVTYEYKQYGIRFFIEIHPKGGIHYGAYFLMEFSHDDKNESPVKYVYSKSSTYLLKDESRQPAFRHEGGAVSPEFMEDIEIKRYTHPQRGVNTPEEILSTPIRDIFRKRTMTAGNIWTEETRAKVNEQRDEIRKARISKIPQIPEEAFPLINNELFMMEKKLSSIEEELSEGTAVDSARIRSMKEELNRMLDSLNTLEEILQSLALSHEDIPGNTTQGASGGGKDSVL